MTARRACAAFALAAAAGCGGPVPPWPEPPQAPVALAIAVAPTTVPLLQPVTVTLDLWRRDGVTVAFAPTAPAERFATRATTVGADVPFGGGHWQRTTLELLPVAGPGELELPAFTATVTAGAGDAGHPIAASTEPQAITVTSTLGEHGAAIEMPGEPFATPFGGWWWLAGGAALLLLLGLAFARFRRRRAAPLPEQVELPPHVQALRELARWKNAARATPAEIAAFYVGVSQTLRVYVERRFGLCAPERTTEEFLRELDGYAALAPHRRELERFLAQCDLVKFAAFVPGEAEHDATWSAAQAFVEATRADRIPQSPTAAETAEVGG